MTDFDVMAIMAKENKDIRATPHFVSAELAKGGGHVTMGVDPQVIHDLVFNDGKYVCVLYIVNEAEFDHIKRQSGSEKG